MLLTGQLRKDVAALHHQGRLVCSMPAHLPRLGISLKFVHLCCWHHHCHCCCTALASCSGEQRMSQGEHSLPWWGTAKAQPHAVLEAQQEGPDADWQWAPPLFQRGRDREHTEALPRPAPWPGTTQVMLPQGWAACSTTSSPNGVPASGLSTPPPPSFEIRRAPTHTWRDLVAGKGMVICQTRVAEIIFLKQWHMRMVQREGEIANIAIHPQFATCSDHTGCSALKLALQPSLQLVSI